MSEARVRSLLRQVRLGGGRHLFVARYAFVNLKDLDGAHPNFLHQDMLEVRCVLAHHAFIAKAKEILYNDALFAKSTRKSLKFEAS